MLVSLYPTSFRLGSFLAAILIIIVKQGTKSCLMTLTNENEEWLKLFNYIWLLGLGLLTLPPSNDQR